ncbi:MAG TPA: cupin domain-containing protein [Nitrospirales bacterium]|jgi:quercetin dioxygenase-like cupin family protein|nr:cupin domain-containing protein [Nitrospirales bacterium]HIA14043.1 cupin domain-containing protein [Nitrospirales bacterium]HIB54619.1 cupin domain-containing protein [Nitrospirales bacterium]HIC04267.1 cupin domain-containing protein [Nitrospirales bacterium]HIN32646.1 cupin domain-containing protein [Nitrospirales bacterium]
MKTVTIADHINYSSEKMKKNNLFEGEHLFTDLYCFEPGQTQKTHTHDNSDKVYIVQKGEGTFKVGVESTVLKKGMATIARAGEPHGVKNHSDKQLTVLVIMAPKP